VLVEMPNSRTTFLAIGNIDRRERRIRKPLGDHMSVTDMEQLKPGLCEETYPINWLTINWAIYRLKYHQLYDLVHPTAFYQPTRY
jgi:hypothetical protein